MGGAYSTHREDAKRIKTLVGKPEGRDHSEEVGTDGRIILEWIFCALDSSGSE
jgi:hypothetical protein